MHEGGISKAVVAGSCLGEGGMAVSIIPFSNGTTAH